jgi:signal transduction histidine kinase
MRLPTWPVAAAALGGLLVLVAVTVRTSSDKAQDIYAQLDELNTHHRHVEGMLRRLRSDVHLSGIYIRDYLLDNARDEAPEYRRRLAELRDANMATLAQLRATSRSEDQARLAGLEANLNEYWETFEPLFDWSVVEKIVQSSRFLRREVLPRRDAVLAIAQEVEELNNRNLAAQRAEVMKRQAGFRADLHALLWRSLLLGFVVALTAVTRLRVLERRSDKERGRVERAEAQMRLLSQQLVATQEEERRKLSRELHDHLGQMLTALRLEVGRLERLRSSPDAQFAQQVAQCKGLADTMLRTVRDLALGLRPSMLDDLGLQPALEWHVRDFRRRSSLRVGLTVRGDLVDLPDQHRTCVYRIVQEALTNCARHAHATRIDITLERGRDQLALSIVDDGVGFDPGNRRFGLGLVGIEERVRDLGGTSSIVSGAGKGTRLDVIVPVPAELPETAVARAAS